MPKDCGGGTTRATTAGTTARAGGALATIMSLGAGAGAGVELASIDPARGRGCLMGCLAGAAIPGFTWSVRALPGDFACAIPVRAGTGTACFCRTAVFAEAVSAVLWGVLVAAVAAMAVATVVAVDTAMAAAVSTTVAVGTAVTVGTALAVVAAVGTAVATAAVVVAFNGGGATTDFRGLVLATLVATTAFAIGVGSAEGDLAVASRLSGAAA